MLRLSPRAANAFDLEVLNHKDEVAYKLEFHSDGNRLYILCRNKKIKVKQPIAAGEIKEMGLAETHKIMIEG